MPIRNLGADKESRRRYGIEAPTQDQGTDTETKRQSRTLTLITTRPDGAHKKLAAGEKLIGESGDCDDNVARKMQRM